MFNNFYAARWVPRLGQGICGGRHRLILCLYAEIDIVLYSCGITSFDCEDCQDIAEQIPREQTSHLGQLLTLVACIHTNYGH